MLGYVSNTFNVFGADVPYQNPAATMLTYTADADREPSQGPSTSVVRALSPSHSPVSTDDVPVVDTTGWAHWMDDHYSRFLKEIDHPLWRDVLAEWVALERVLEFQMMVRLCFYCCKCRKLTYFQRVGFAVKKRPDEVHQWIKNARANRVVPKAGIKFVASWYSWWDHLNPEWRERKDGRLVRGGTGDWSSMLISGKNGFVNIVAALSALYDLLAVEEWEEAAKDIKWVIHEARLQKQQRG